MSYLNNVNHKQRYNQTLNVIVLPCFSSIGMGNGLETESLL